MASAGSNSGFDLPSPLFALGAVSIAALTSGPMTVRGSSALFAGDPVYQLHGTALGFDIAEPLWELEGDWLSALIDSGTIEDAALAELLLTSWRPMPASSSRKVSIRLTSKRIGEPLGIIDDSEALDG